MKFAPAPTNSLTEKFRCLVGRVTPCAPQAATGSANGAHGVTRPTFPHFALRAFTLAEVLAALVFMAILIPVALEGLSIATRAGEVAARKSEAALVAERILNENIVTTNWNKTIQNGSLRQGARDFRWILRNDPWTQDPNQNAMRLLSVEVLYAAQGRDYSIRLRTLVDSAPPLSPTTSQP